MKLRKWRNEHVTNELSNQKHNGIWIRGYMWFLLFLQMPILGTNAQLFPNGDFDSNASTSSNSTSSSVSIVSVVSGNSSSSEDFLNRTEILLPVEDSSITENLDSSPSSILNTSNTDPIVDEVNFADEVSFANEASVAQLTDPKTNFSIPPLINPISETTSTNSSESLTNSSIEGLGNFPTINSSIPVLINAFNNETLNESSISPTVFGSDSPSESPSFFVSSGPSVFPSISPSLSVFPTFTPSRKPSIPPSTNPTLESSIQPSQNPSKEPSKIPTNMPSFLSSSIPSLTAFPSSIPTTNPSISPSFIPSTDPTLQPSLYPTATPTHSPSEIPSTKPTTYPSLNPTHSPSAVPSLTPSSPPTISFKPSLVPSISSAPIFQEIQIGAQVFEQSFLRQENAKFSDAQQLSFCEVLEGYTSEFEDTTHVTTSCKITQQDLRRTQGSTKLFKDMMSDDLGVDWITNDTNETLHVRRRELQTAVQFFSLTVRFIMNFTSIVTDVERYPTSFLDYMNTNFLDEDGRIINENLVK